MSTLVNHEVGPSSMGARLREERLRLGLNQSELAQTGGVSKTSQVFYEGDERSPDAAYLKAIEKCGVDSYYVFAGVHREELASKTFNVALLSEILKRIDTNTSQPPEKRAKLAAVFYKRLAERGSVPPGYVGAFMEDFLHALSEEPELPA